jgi:FixJ family two-component response regulator
MSEVTPMVSVVDDDVSVRESLESLIRCEGWQPKTFASAKNSSTTQGFIFRTASYLTFLFLVSTV